jgi:hypothetical protein
MFFQPEKNDFKLMTHMKDFCLKGAPNLPNSKVKKRIAKFLQHGPENSQNIKGFLNFFYFHVWSIVKFD